MLKGLWCDFLRSLDTMESELRCLCNKEKKRGKNSCKEEKNCVSSTECCDFFQEECCCDRIEKKC